VSDHSRSAMPASHRNSAKPVASGRWKRESEITPATYWRMAKFLLPTSEISWHPPTAETVTSKKSSETRRSIVIRIALVWSKVIGDFPTLVTDSEVEIYSLEPFSKTDRVYRMGPGVKHVSKKAFDGMIGGEVTSYFVLPRQVASRHKGRKLSTNRPSTYRRSQRKCKRPK
jgi:hypothetical protein